mgnify:FL=1
MLNIVGNMVFDVCHGVGAGRGLQILMVSSVQYRKEHGVQ